MKKYLNLDNFMVSYDPASECFRITSKDQKLKGKPFQITLPAKSKEETESYTIKTLFEVMEATGDFPALQARLPESKEFPDKTTVTEIYEKLNDRREFLAEVPVNGIYCPLVGETFGGEKTFFNLHFPVSNNSEIGEMAAHTLIGGRAGSGTTSLLSTILKNASMYPNEITSVILSRDELQSTELKGSSLNTVKGRNIIDSYNLLVKLDNLITQRIKYIERTGNNTFIDLKEFSDVDIFDNKVIYLFVDRIDEFLNAVKHSFPVDFYDSVIAKFDRILTFGSICSIYVFMSAWARSNRFRVSKEFDRVLLPNFFRRVSMGWSDPLVDDYIFNFRPDIPDKLLKPGRAVISVNGETPELFQVYSL